MTAAIEANNLRIWNFTRWMNAAAQNAEAGQPVSRSDWAHSGRPLTVRSPASAPSGICGGDLPPCYVMNRESGGLYSAYNPTGCGGSGCYGKWQFSGEWAGKLGLPLDLSTATPEQQDAAARILWNNGAGCSNWDAC